MLWAASAYSCGLVAGVYVWRPALWWLVGAVAFCASGAYFLPRRSYAAFALALSALFVTGAFMMQVRVPESAVGADVLTFADGREVIVTGHVVKEGILREKTSGDPQQRLDLETEQITTTTDAGTRTFAIHSGLRVTFYGHELSDDERTNASAEFMPRQPFGYGERLRFPAKLLPPHNFRNPGAFDYAGYLAQDGIIALGSTKSEAVELLPGFAGNRFELWRTRVRRNLLARIHALWKPDEAALIDAMLIGENSFLGRETLTDFQRTGTYHVLVISGLKVAVLALVMFWLLRRLRVSDIAASATTILLTVAYALLTDVGAPVWRATLMLALYLGARLLYRRKSILNTIGAAALALLIVDPTALLGASFQLSFPACWSSPESALPCSSGRRNLCLAHYGAWMRPVTTRRWIRRWRNSGLTCG